MEKNALYTTTAVLLSISVCHRESGLESKFSETPRCVFGCVTGVLHTRPAEPRTHVVHHVRTTVERDARTRRKQRHVVVTKATLIYERCSVSRVDGLAITRNEGQFVSRLARTSSFRSLFFLFLLLLFSSSSSSSFPPPSLSIRKKFLTIYRYLYRLVYDFLSRAPRLLLLLLLLLCTRRVTKECNWKNRVSGRVTSLSLPPSLPVVNHLLQPVDHRLALSIDSDDLVGGIRASLPNSA